MLECFCGAGKAQKLNTRIFVYNTEFVHLIIMDCHNPPNILTRKFYTWRNSTQKFSKLQYVTVTCWAKNDFLNLKQTWFKMHTATTTQQLIQIMTTYSNYKNERLYTVAYSISNNSNGVYNNAIDVLYP